MIERVLITGSRAPIAYEVIQQQVKLGRSVWATDSTSKVSVKRSKFLSGFVKTRAPRFDIEGYIDDINAICKYYKIDVIIPLNEESFYLSEFRDRLDVDVWVEDFNKVLSMHNKYNFSKILSNLGFNVPCTKFVQTRLDLEEFLSEQLGDEFIIKQAFTRFGQSVRKVSREELMNTQQIDYPFLVQQFISGTEWCSYSMAYEGEALSTALYLSNSQESYNASTHFKSEQNEELCQIINDLIKALNWSYQIAFDVIQSEMDGKYYFIECNPRATNGALFMRKEVWKLKQSTPRYETRQLVFVSFFNFMRQPKRSSFDKLKYGKDVFWHPEDKAIFFEQLKCGAGWWLEARTKKRKINVVTTEDIEWNGDKEVI